MCVSICFHPKALTTKDCGAWSPEWFGGGAHTLALSKHSLIVWAYRRTHKQTSIRFSVVVCFSVFVYFCFGGNCS